MVESRIARTNPFLNGTIDLQGAKRSLVVESLLEAVDFVHSRAKGDEVVGYRFGFARLPFQPDRRSGGTAAHFWSEDLPRNECPHTHIFGLRSRKVRGGLTNLTWRIVPGASETAAPHRLVVPSYANSGGTVFESHQPVHLEVASIQEIRADEDGYYEVPKGTIHSTTGIKQGTITAIDRVDPSARDLPRSYIPEGGRENVPPVSLGEDGWRPVTTMLQKL